MLGSVAFRFLAAVCLAASAFGMAPFVVYSTNPHFSCSGVCDDAIPSDLSQGELRGVVDYLKSGKGYEAVDSSDKISKYFSKNAEAPEVILTILSDKLQASGAKSLLTQLASGIGAESNTASSVFGRTSSPALLADERRLSAISEEAHSHLDVLSLGNLANADGASVFTNGKPDVLTMFVRDENEDGFIHVLQSVSRKTKGSFALIWTTREGETEANAPENASAAKNSTATGNKGAPRMHSTYMRPPEISEAGLAGLLVAAIFLLVFIPGFLCLWRIQPPQTFEFGDSTDARKKMQ